MPNNSLGVLFICVRVFTGQVLFVLFTITVFWKRAVGMKFNEGFIYLLSDMLICLNQYYAYLNLYWILPSSLQYALQF